MRVRITVAAALLAVVSLPLGCAPTREGPSPVPPASTGPTPTPTPIASPSPSPTPVSWQSDQRVAFGAYLLGLPTGSVDVHDGWREVSFTVDDERVGLPVDASGWEIVSGVVTLDDAFLTRPDATGADGAAAGASFEAGERGPVLRIAEDAKRPVTVSFLVGEELVEATEWESATRILITPNPLGRALAPSDPVAAAAFAPTLLAQVGDDPRLEGDSVTNQVACHMVGARDKPTWNIETDRPDKGLLGFMAARCN